MLTIANVQLNPIVGDIPHNINQIKNSFTKACQAGAELVIFPEMVITGYPPEDLVLRQKFQRLAMDAVEELAKLTSSDTAMIVGGIEKNSETNQLFNSAFFLHAGKISHRIHKQHLPNYGVFDEKRVFNTGQIAEPIYYRGLAFTLVICEDIWQTDTAQLIKQQKTDFIISIHASPFETSKHQWRRQIIERTITSCQIPVIYVNQVGGQDELVFDGGSFIMDKHRQLVAQQPYFVEDILISIWDKKDNEVTVTVPHPPVAVDLSKEERIYQALCLGFRDYVHKNGFKSVVLGMSGGIDSAISAVIAVDSIGKEAVRLVMLPSHYTSAESIQDATDCANALGVPLETIPITSTVEHMTHLLEPFFAHTKPDTTEENLQSRIRGLLLMALSNKFGHLLLTTGNKSEMAVGYATLYGDMCGGFNVLKDIYKMDVYALAKWRNTQNQVIPDSIITKAPTAELRTNQTDQDSLPPYPILDHILYLLLERQESTANIIQQTGYDASIVRHVAKLVLQAEYKRRQAPPGIKITSLAFGRDRRYPITNKFFP